MESRTAKISVATPELRALAELARRVNERDSDLVPNLLTVLEDTQWLCSTLSRPQPLRTKAYRAYAACFHLLSELGHEFKIGRRVFTTPQQYFVAENYGLKKKKRRRTVQSRQRGPNSAKGG